MNLEVGTAMYLAGHGSKTKPRLIELQYQRIMRKRPIPTVCTPSVCDCGLWPLWTLLIVPTKRNRGHIGSNTTSQSSWSKEAASNSQRAAGDRGRDALAGSLGVEGGEATRREREPGVLLAEAVSSKGSSEAGRPRSLYR